MADLLDFRIEELPEAMLLHVRGEVDIGTAPTLRDAVKSALGTRAHVVVNIHEVTYIDVSGFRALEECKRAVDGSQCLVLAASAPTVHKVVEILQFGKIIPTFSSPEEALAFLRTQGTNPREAP